MGKILSGKRKFVILFLLVGTFLIWRFVLSPDTPNLESTEIRKGRVQEELVLSGELKAEEHAQLPFASSGRVSWLGVKEGDRVKKGQLLAKLDTESLSAAIERSEADLRAAEATLLRVYDEVKGHDKDETFEQKEDRTTAEVAKDKAWDALRIAQDNLKNANLYAPFDGIISSVILPSAGINTLSTQSQIEVVNPSTVYFEVSADQTEVFDLEIGQTVNIILDPIPDEEFLGTVSFISYTPLSGEVGTVYEVKVTFPTYGEKLSKLRIGMTGDASIIKESKEDAYSLPPSFVNSDRNGKYILLNNPKNKVYIETGLESEESIEIIGDGFSEGDTVYD